MKNSSCIFDIVNDSQIEMLLYLEPEGSEYALFPGKAVQVHIFGNEHPITIKHSTDSSGRQQISFWPLNGGFELFVEGKSVWDLVS